MENIKNKIHICKMMTFCLFRFIFKGSAKTKINHEPKAVLIVQLAWLGDMVCTTPMFVAIKKRYPDSRVMVLGMKRNEQILGGHPYVDRYIVWEDSFSYIKKELNTEGIDFACITSPNFIALAFLYLSGIRHIVVPFIVGGYCPYETIPFKIISPIIATRVSHTMEKYAPREYLRLLEPIDIYTEDTKKVLSFSKESDSFVDNLFEEYLIKKDDFVVVMSASCGNKIKNWPADRFAKLADYLIDEYSVKIFFIGTDTDKKETSDVIEKMHNKSKVVSLLSRLNIDQLKSFISKVDMLISVDTGPIYIAEAFNVATIDIIGPVHPEEQPPKGYIHKLAIAPGVSNFPVHIMNSRVYDKEAVRVAVQGITVDIVKGIFDSLYEVVLRKKIQNTK